MKDEDILALIKAGKQEGLSHILDRYSGLMAYIIRNTGSFCEEDISECLSDILFTIWKRVSKYDKTKASFKTWIMLVARGCALDYMRKNKKYNNVVSLEDIGEIAADGSESDRLCDSSVISFLQELTPPDNEIFYRRFVLGESVAEISRLLNITQDNVYKRLSRGREKLKSMMLKEGCRYA
jgi:RNA polymerase sigma-70 factor (ECF subfamily)